jgi:hypothetical protein
MAKRVRSARVLPPAAFGLAATLDGRWDQIVSFIRRPDIETR